MTPVAAWASIQNDPAARADYVSMRGSGGFVRATWDEVTEIIAAANAYTIKQYGPDRILGFSPIPAMSMVSYAAGSRYLSLIASFARNSATGDKSDLSAVPESAAIWSLVRP